MSPPTLLVATKNPGKLREVRAVLAGLALAIESLADYPDLPDAVEDGETFEENARIKALHYANLTGRWTLADDSGLDVDALGGRPGVRSARYAGPACDPATNNAKLVSELRGVSADERTARFRCVIALARSKQVITTASGVVEGLIVDQPRGQNGFGYDPHFLVPELGMTTAEMSPEQKNRISHRGKAVGAIRPAIERWIAEARGDREA